MKQFTVILVLAIAFMLRATAAEVASDFDTANRLYSQGKFSEASAGYEKLIGRGAVSPALYFNLGNAYFKSGQQGRAIAAYRRAERLSPRDPDVQANLRFARNQIANNPSVRPAAWQVWLAKLTVNEWTALAVAAFWVWLALLALGQWREDWRRKFRGYAAMAGWVTLLLGGCTAAAWSGNYSVKSALVIAQDAAARSGPLEDSSKTHTLHDGTELTVLDERDDWLQVCDGSQRIGWLKRDTVELLKPEGGR